MALMGSSILILRLSVTTLNYFYKLHPIRLNLPFSNSQSFKVNNNSISGLPKNLKPIM